MKNYPLNPFIDKYHNWTKTYLQEFNTKIWALKNYSEFFLTDYIQSEIEYESSTYIDERGNIHDIIVLKPAVLEFHNFALINKDCYLETDYTDTNAVERLGLDGSIHYYRYIPQGTYIISNARPEGTIDANGIQSYDFYIAENWLSDFDPLAINNAGTLGLSLPSYGSANPDRINWRNFVIQPSGFASLYTMESIRDGLRFVYQEKGGESFGTDLDLAMMFQNPRYEFFGSANALKINSYKYSLDIFSKDSAGIVTIGVLASTNDTPVVIPWTSINNPPMSFIFYGRDKENIIYGEEIIIDSERILNTHKFDSHSSLEYTLLFSKDDMSDAVTFEGDII